MKIGVDLGGTNIRVGRVCNGKIINKDTILTNAERSEQDILDDLINLIEKCMTPEVKSIGIGVPSVVDVKKGIVYNVANIPSWREVHLKEIIETKFRIPVSVNNDCNCFALGEHYCGEAVGYEDAVCIALGTGVGAGIIFNNQLCNGANTGAGEIGEVPYLGYNYEYFCSSHYFVREHNSTGKEICEKAAQGNNEALRALNDFGMHVGNLIKLVLLVYDPQIIVFGGSIANAYPYFSKGIYEVLKKFPYPQTIANLKIACSSKQDISLLGASQLS